MSTIVRARETDAHKKEKERIDGWGESNGETCMETMTGKKQREKRVGEYKSE